MSGAVPKADAQRIPSSPPIGTVEELIEMIDSMAEYLESDRNDAAWPAQLDKPGSVTRLATARDLRRVQSRIAEVERLTERVKAAVNWVQPPFLTPEASPDEVRSRISLLLADIDAALSQHRTRDE